MGYDKELKYNASGYYDPTAFEALTKVQKGQIMEVLKGDIYFLERNNKGDIPVVIVSNNIGNKFSDFVNVVYMSDNIKNPMPTHVELNCRGLTTAMCEQIHCVRKDHLHSFVRSCTETELDKLDAALMLSCGIAVDMSALTEQLQKQIEYMDEQLCEKNKTIDQLQCDLEDAEEIIENMRISDTPTIAPETDSIRVTAERDLYKNLYEQLLHKMIDQKVG